MEKLMLDVGGEGVDGNVGVAEIKIGKKNLFCLALPGCLGR